MRPPLRSSGHRPHGGSLRPSHKPVGHRPHGPSMNPRRPNMNYARPNRSVFIQAPSYETRPFLKSSAVKTKYRAPWGSSQNNIDDKGYWDSGCSRHMTGNISYLSDFEPFDGGYVSFGQGGCKITGKGTIKTVRYNRGRGLPTNSFDNDHTCTACLKGKQHKASCKSKTKDETSGILKKFITKIENLKDLKVKVIRTPAIGFLKPFGCYVMILNTLDNLGKFEAKWDEGYFIGYSMSCKAFKVFNKRKRRVEENLRVEFLENKAIEKGAGPNWKGLLPNTFSSDDDSDDDQEKEETEKKRNRTPSPPPIPPPENYGKVRRTFEEDMKMLEERWAKEAADRKNKKKNRKVSAAAALED
nr:ribonuclease H-like domain-containing protein [Tanacetum cinerariifolium]